VSRRCSRPSPSPRATRTRSPTRSVTRSWTPCFAQDPSSRVAVETLITTASARRRRGDHRGLRRTFRRSCASASSRSATTVPQGLRRSVLRCEHRDGAQSPDIARGVDPRTRCASRAREDPLTSRAPAIRPDFGFACDETPELMPPIALAPPPGAAALGRSKDGRCLTCVPTAAQVTIEYVDGKPSRLTRSSCRASTRPTRPGHPSEARCRRAT